MKAHLLVLILCICSIQMFYSQEDDGVVSLSLPVRNSLTFNRFIINPTFSFVREQHKYISFFNKREWVQFDNSPNTYLASYSGRFGENTGAGIALFQQDYGILTTFGGTANFAYNVRMARDSNLTFGINIGAYKSRVNTGNVVTNVEDPSLQNIPENFLLTINPGINYGLAFIDIGISMNNLAVYNFESSELLQDNPEQGFQAHLMYTGYFNSRGFFDEAKFSGLLKSEFKKEETIISAQAMVTVPKGIWAQVGYNSVFGISGGAGINITPQIAIEYNFEKAIGDLTDFGPSHDISLAYRFKNKDRYDYSSGDEVTGLISNEKRKPVVSNISKEKAEENRKLAAERKAEQKLQQETQAQAKLLAAQQEADAQAKLLAEQKAQQEADAKAKLLAEQKAQQEADAQARLLAQQKTQQEADAQAKLLAEQKAQQEADAQAKLLAEQKAQQEADAQAKLLAEQKTQQEADAQAKLLAEQKAQQEADAQAKDELITNPKDELGKSMLEITQQTEAAKKSQNDLLKQFDDIVEVKDKDLKDLKKENDLGEQGIAVQPKPFKSITAENNTLNKIKSNLDNIITTRNKKIEELQELYDDNYETDTLYNDEVYLHYRKTLKRLKTEQAEAITAKAQLETKLKDIKAATEFERRRRIKRAAFDNEEERYSQDRATLQNIKQTTPASSSILKEEDFDFGEEQSNNIQILKNVKNVENGYYLIIAVHTDKEKRNDFITKVVASGRTNVDFFYDVNTSEYYIYYDKFNSIEQANRALKSKGDKSYNTKMSLVKIEN
ncbi:PorP/SprF family type IX secretion system membrane protein [Psychroserpens sp.]